MKGLRLKTLLYLDLRSPYLTIIVDAASGLMSAKLLKSQI